MTGAKENELESEERGLCLSMVLDLVVRLESMIGLGGVNIVKVFWIGFGLTLVVE